MKQEARKNKTWLWLAVAIVALAVIVGIVLAFVLPRQQAGPDTAGADAKLYWNVDREQFVDPNTGLSTREPGENGLYRVRFALDGEQVELSVTGDRQLVNYIDAMKVMGLVLDANGVVVDALDPTAVATEVAKELFVKKAEGDTIIINSSKAMNGMETTVTISGKTGVYDVSPTAEVVGQAGTCGPLDIVSVYADADGNVTHVFIAEHPVQTGVYWRVDRYYNAATGQTTRKPDTSGYYVFRMAAQGKELTVRTKDKDIAAKIDSFTGQCMGLKLSGNIVEEVYDPNCVCGAWPVGEKRYVTAMSGTVVTLAAWSDLTLITNSVIPENCEIYDVTGYPGVKYGSKTQVQMYDRVMVYQDIAYNVTHIFVIERYVENAKIYYNTSRLYSSQTKETARIPDADGYYVFNMCCEGKEVQVKTKNKSFATFIDQQNAPIVALEVKNGIVQAVYPAVAAEKYSYKQLNTNYIGKIDKDGTIHAYYYDGDQKYDRVSTFKMAENCVVYNVSTYYLKNRGEKTTLQVDDQVQAIATNPKGELVQIFILKRKLDAPLYWKTEQKYNANTGETTRVPNADGWYIFDLAVNGEVKQFKTKDKAIASAVDRENQAFTIRTKGDVILGVYSPIVAKNVRDYTAGNFDVMKLSGNTATVKRNLPTASNFGDSYDITFAKDCKFYDVSPYAEKFGAATTLKEGDRITGLINEKGEVAYCYIVYKNTRQAGPVSLCQHCGKEVFWEPYVGNLYSVDAHFYLTGDRIRGTQTTVGSANENAEQIDVVLDLNGHSLTVDKRGFLVYGTLSILDSAGGGSIASGNADASYGGVAMVIGNGNMNLYGGTLTQTQDAPLSQRGGVLYISDNARLNIYGGIVTGGNAATGGDIYMAGSSALNMSGGSVGDIYANTTGKLTLSGTPMIAGIKLAEGMKLTLGALEKGTKVAVSATGVFTSASEKTADYAAYFAPVNKKDSIQIQDNTLVYVKTPIDLNKIDNSNLAFTQGTTEALCPVCDQVVIWTAVTAEKSIYPNDGNHYYLAEDVAFDGTADAFFLSPTKGTACLHLNGHNITATAQKAITAYGGTLNVMGNGTVSGNYATAWTGAATAHVTAGGTLNLCGGTYVKPVTNITANPIVFAGNGTVNMYNGATVDGTGIPGTYTATGVLVEHANAVFNLYGGTVKNGAALGNGGNMRLNSGKMSISGGTVSGSDVYVAVTGTTTVSGAPVISELKLPAGVKIILGELTQGADITVSAEGIFTETSEKTAQFTDYFKPADETAKIEEQQNALAYVKAAEPEEPEKPAFDNSDLVFAEGTTQAMCPACEKEVTWEAISGELTSTKWLQADGHYYLSDDVTYAGTDQAVYSPTGAVAKTACLHLNGHNLTATAGKAIHCGDGTLNVMGEGTVSGSGTAYGGATIHTWGSGKLNLYGGTYTKGASTYPVIFVGSYTVELYDGVTVEGQGTTPSSYALVYLESNNAVVNIRGGVIQNGNSTGTCGNLKAYQGTINILGGTIQNGVGTTGGNIHIYNTGKLNISGGEIKNGSVYIAVSDAATLSGAPVIDQLILPVGIKVKLGEMAEGAVIKVSADGVFTQANEKAADYAGYFKPADEGAKVEAQNNVLTCVKSEQEPEAPRIDNSNLVFDQGTTDALCPVCEEKVTWTAISGTKTNSVWLNNAGAHYYLDGDLSSSAGDGVIAVNTNAGSAACLHLNGHNITSTVDSVVRYYKAGALNIMGSGTVSGSGIVAASKWRAANLNVTGGGQLNLYGGTFTKGESDAPVIWVWAGQVNLYDGAKIVGTDQNLGSYSSTVLLQNADASFYMYGGEISGGHNQNSGGNVHINNGAFTLSGGTITGGVGKDYFGGNVYLKAGFFTMTGGEISGGTAAYYGDNVYINTGATANISGGTISGGNVYVAASGTTTLSGAPVIEELKLPANVTVTLGELKQDAHIFVDAEGVFTAANEKAQDYAGYFEAKADGKTVAVENNTLIISNATVVQKLAKLLSFLCARIMI